MRRTAILAGLTVLALLAAVFGTNAVEVWTKHIKIGLDDFAHDVTLLDDGGYLLAAETALQYEPTILMDGLLLRLDAAGTTIWEKTYGGDRSASLYSLLELEEGGFVVSGMVQSADGDDSDAFLLRVDADGNELWSRSYGTQLNEGARTVVRNSDGGFFLIGNSIDPNDIVANPGAAGYAGAAGRGNVFVVRTDANGNEIWSRRYESELNTLASGGRTTDDGGAIILAYILYYPVEDNDTVLFKIDSEGNEVWTRTWEEGKSSGYSLAPTSDGGCAISGILSYPEDPAYEKSQAMLIRVDAEGNELWSATYGDSDRVETAHSVLEMSDGRILCIGWQEQDLYSWTDDILLAAFNREGEMLWQEVIDSYYHNLHEGFVEHPDGSLVVAGAASRPGRSFLIQLLKIDISEAGDV